MRIFYFYFLCLCVSNASCQNKNPVSKKPLLKTGKEYVHFWKHSDSIRKIIYDSIGNYKKEWEKNGDRVITEAYKLDGLEDSLYRAKYHFSDYYYMWNYTTESSRGWGENDITLDHYPTVKEIKDYVWNTMFKTEKGRKYEALEVVGIELKSSNPNTLQNLPIQQRQELNYQKSTYKQLAN